MSVPEISVIIASTVERQRAESLMAAIESVKSQEHVRGIPLVVANGDRIDKSLLYCIRNLRGINVIESERRGAPAARADGRAQVNTEYFAFLDDDDRYLSNAFIKRIKVMHKEDADVVLSTGYRMNDGCIIESGTGIKQAKKGTVEALEALIDDNWLTPSSGLYKTDRIDLELMEGLPAYHEWTVIAFRLVLGAKLAFLDDPCYMMNDTPGSLSKSVDYFLGGLEVIEHLLQMELPFGIKIKLWRRYGAVLHDVTDWHRIRKQWGPAWKYHLRSLIQPGGYRYLLFSRRLMYGLFSK